MISKVIELGNLKVFFTLCTAFVNYLNSHQHVLAASQLWLLSSGSEKIPTLLCATARESVRGEVQMHREKC